MAGHSKGRRNRSSVSGIVGIIALFAGVLWIYFTAGAGKAILSPLGILLVVGAVLAISGSTRKAARNHNANRELPRTFYAQRREAAGRSSRPFRAAQRETWPYDGSYCPHCGLQVRMGDTVCRRCGGELEIIISE